MTREKLVISSYHATYYSKASSKSPKLDVCLLEYISTPVVALTCTCTL